MLPKHHRPTTKSVHYLLRKGKRRHGRLISIAWVGRQHRTRRGVHIAKKVARLATQRNAAKRAVFAAIQDHGGMSCEGGLFFVTVNKKNADLWQQLVATSGDISIYNRTYDAVQRDVQSFVKRYEKRSGKSSKVLESGKK